MATSQSTTDVIKGATWAQLGLWLGLGALFIWLGFMRGKKGFWWKLLGVLGVLNVLISLGEIASRIGRKTPSQ